MFSIVLKQIRLSLFFTQKKLCEKAGIPLGTYKNWELGRQLPDPNSWKKLVQFLRTTGTRKNLFDGKGDEMKYFRIDINTEITAEIEQYIFDCWVAFVTNDLALMPTDLMIYMQED